MKTKRMLRYYCDWCKKSGGSARHIKHHEERCTLNPRRVCGMCQLLELEQQPLRRLRAMLPKPGPYLQVDENGYESYDAVLTSAVHDALPALREATDNCPVCILAAIRQQGIPLPMVDEFDYSKEFDAAMEGANSREALECQHG